MPEGTKCVQRDKWEGRDGLAVKAGDERTAWQRREGKDGGQAMNGRLPRGRSWRFEMPTSALLLKGISYNPKNYSKNYDKSPKINSLV